jgi:hypothetical protein
MAKAMNSLIERIEDHPTGAVLRTNGMGVGEVARRLETGESLDAVARGASLQPRDLLAALAWVGLGAPGTEGPALVPESPRHPKLAKALGEPALAALFPHANRPARLALAAGLLQAHDFWDASHNAAQEADDLGEQNFSAYWHGIAHRREPDAGNAQYWFRRVGRHPLFGTLGVAARDLLVERLRDDLADRLTTRQGTWDPTAFINATESARRGGPDATICRQLQRLEMSMLLVASLDAIDPA